MKTYKQHRDIWCPKLRGDFEAFNWYPACGQVKIDGEYELIEWNGKDILAVNKYGKTRTDFPALQSILDSNLKQNSLGPCTLIAELYYGDGKNNALYKFLENKESDELKLYVHDIYLPFATTYERLMFLKKHGLTDFKVINDKEQAIGFFNETIRAGYEGIVLKPSSSKIQNANQWVKVKVEDETEMIVKVIYEDEERVDLDFEGKTIGCKAPNALRARIKVGQRVLVKHNGFTDNSVRHPTIKEVLNVQS